jgi:hypothetical protein
MVFLPASQRVRAERNAACEMLRSTVRKIHIAASSGRKEIRPLHQVSAGSNKRSFGVIGVIKTALEWD